MAWFLRSSQSGVHVVYGQKAERSCGIACVIMVNFKLKKWQLAAAVSAVPAETIIPGGTLMAAPATIAAVNAAVKSEEEVDAAYSKATGRPYRGTTDTDATMLPRVLNQLNIGRWTATYIPANKLVDMILDRPFKDSPCIALVHWRPSSGGGGHFVVCDNVVQGSSGGPPTFVTLGTPRSALYR